MNIIRIVPCPRCGKGARWQGNPARPFCSPRCREIDMAAWYTESYRIPIEGGSESAEASGTPEDANVGENETVRGAGCFSNRGGNE